MRGFIVLKPKYEFSKTTKVGIWGTKVGIWGTFFFF
jgi:hypothetical protein